jgi:hypothetical protein
MPYCFVIQPFDGGRFDKRFSDVFKPAIEGAGLISYRVDQDPAVSIPIDDIEKGIRGAAVCFADITLDNPNVWFELGYALASKMEICIVCSKERVEKFPFDVQHRSIFDTAWIHQVTFCR